jgi:hypothetical protein
LPGICEGNPETTVFAHLNGAVFGKAAGMKAHDIAGCFADYACHTYLDTGHSTNPRITDLELSQALLRAVVGTWVVLIEDGVISVPLDTVTPLMERPIRPRKPKAQRTKINSRPFYFNPKLHDKDMK